MNSTRGKTKPMRLVAMALVVLAGVMAVALPAPVSQALPVSSCITTYLNAAGTEIIGSKHVTCSGQIIREGQTSTNTIVDCEPCGGGGCVNTCWAVIGGTPFYSCCS